MASAPRQDLRQHPRLDLGPGGAGDRRRADAVAHQTGADAAGAGARQFLRCDDLHERVGLDPAELLRKAETEQADRGSLDIKPARKLAGLVPAMRVRLDLAFDEAAHHPTKRLVVGGIERAQGGGSFEHGEAP
jgi:hypothetical protein